LLTFATYRVIAGDEGFYTLAIRLVSEGKVPYKDFFYPQMPLLPYIYGSLIKIPFFSTQLPSWYQASWYQVRLLSAMFSILTATLVYLFLTAYTSPIIASAVVLTLTISPLFFPWMITVETYALTNFLMILSILLAEVLRKHHLQLSNRVILLYSVLIGTSLALATQTRLYSVALLPIIFLFVPGKARIPLLVAFGVACIPTFILAFDDIEKFFFNNLGYHVSRTKLKLSRQLRDKLHLLSVLAGFSSSIKYEGYNGILLFWGGMFGALYNIKRMPILTISALVLTIVSFIPSPAYYQYFCLTAPLWATTLGLMLFDLMNKYPYTRYLSIICLVFGIIGYQDNTLKYLGNGQGVIGIPTSANIKNFTLEATLAVSEEIDQQFTADDIVFANWNGYLFHTKAQSLPGTDNVFGMRVADKSAILARKFDLRSHANVLNILRNKKGYIDGLILREQFIATKPRFMATIKEAGCKRTLTILGVSIFRCL
jgi:hypothetical protein